MIGKSNNVKAFGSKIWNDINRKTMNYRLRLSYLHKNVTNENVTLRLGDSIFSKLTLTKFEFMGTPQIFLVVSPCVLK